MWSHSSDRVAHLPSCALPPLQDVLEEMEAEYGKDRDVLKAAVKERGIEVRAPPSLPSRTQTHTQALSPSATPPHTPHTPQPTCTFDRTVASKRQGPPHPFLSQVPPIARAGRR